MPVLTRSLIQVCLVGSKQRLKRRRLAVRIVVRRGYPAVVLGPVIIQSPPHVIRSRPSVPPIVPPETTVASAHLLVLADVGETLGAITAILVRAAVAIGSGELSSIAKAAAHGAAARPAHVAKTTGATGGTPFSVVDDAILIAITDTGLPSTVSIVETRRA